MLLLIIILLSISLVNIIHKNGERMSYTCIINSTSLVDNCVIMKCDSFDKSKTSETKILYINEFGICHERDGFEGLVATNIMSQ